MTGFVIIIFLLILVFASVIVLTDKSDKTAKEVAPPQTKPSAKQDDDELLADVNRLLAIAEVIRQAKEHGDDETCKKCLANKYDGELPVQKADGTWTDIYTKSLSFSIAGINFRKGIREKIGDLDILLVPDPNNEYDPNAIKIMSSDGTHLGYVPASMTEEVRTFTSSAFPYHGTATITEKTDDDDDTRTFFVGESIITKNNYNPK